MNNEYVWQNPKITRHMVEQAIARKEGRKHETVDYVALFDADNAMEHKSLKSFVESYQRHKMKRMYNR